MDGGTVIGWCDITPLGYPVWEHCGKLGMGIVAGYRGKGIGTQLMQAALDHARRKGLTRIELIVREQNTPAIAPYKRMGFVVEGCKRNATRVDGRYENDLCMGLLYD